MKMQFAVEDYASRQAAWSRKPVTSIHLLNVKVNHAIIRVAQGPGVALKAQHGIMISEGAYPIQPAKKISTAMASSA